MSAKQINRNSITVSFFRISCLLFSVLWLLAAIAPAQIAPKKTRLPVLQDYKGIKIGMTASEVREKLGKAQSDDKDGFLYVFSDDESAQILVDGDQKVRTLSIMYGGDNQKPMKFEEIFGKDVEPEKQAGGAIYKLVKYEQAGYWISYNRMAGDKPTTILVIQKMP